MKRFLIIIAVLLLLTGCNLNNGSAELTPAPAPAPNYEATLQTGNLTQNALAPVAATGIIRLDFGDFQIVNRDYYVESRGELLLLETGYGGRTFHFIENDEPQRTEDGYLWSITVLTSDENVATMREYIIEEQGAPATSVASYNGWSLSTWKQTDELGDFEVYVAQQGNIFVLAMTPITYSDVLSVLDDITIGASTWPQQASLSALHGLGEEVKWDDFAYYPTFMFNGALVGIGDGRVVASELVGDYISETIEDFLSYADENDGILLINDDKLLLMRAEYEMVDVDDEIVTGVYYQLVFAQHDAVISFIYEVFDFADSDIEEFDSAIVTWFNIWADTYDILTRR